MNPSLAERSVRWDSALKRSDDLKNTNNAYGRMIADALEAKGITSDQPESPPNVRWAAFQAFSVVYAGSSAKDWNELTERLSPPNAPRNALHRKLAQICHTALRKHDLNNDLREPITFAWGVYTAKLEDDKGSAPIA